VTYKINAWEDGTTVAVVRFDPFRVDMQKPNMDGIRSALRSVGDRKQMNRTAGPEPEDKANSTSYETYQEPSREFLEGQLVQAVTPGFAVVNPGLSKAAAALGDEQDMEFLNSLLEQVTSDGDSDRRRNLWKAFLNRVVLRKISKKTGQAATGAAEWTPALHPRDPRTGQFVERPFDVPDELLEMDTPDIVRELANEDPDFADKVEGLQIDMDEDLQELVSDAADGDVDVPEDDSRYFPGDEVGDDVGMELTETGVDMLSEGDIVAIDNTVGRVEDANSKFIRVDRGDGVEELPNISHDIRAIQSDALDEVPDVPDDSDGESGVPAEILDTPNLGKALAPDDMSRGDDVKVLEDGELKDGTVDQFLRQDDGTKLAEIDYEDGLTITGPEQFDRAVFPSDVDPDEPPGELVPEELEDGDLIKVEVPGRDDAIGYFEGTSPGKIHITPQVGSVPVDEEIEVPVAGLAQTDAQITKYDTDDMLDLPDIEPLPPDEGGLNDVPDTADGEALANAIRRHDDWMRGQIKDISSPIDDEKLAEAREVLAPVLDRAKDTEVAKQYAQRTVIGDKANRAHNGGRRTPRDQTMNEMTLDTSVTGAKRTVRHEMGHGLVQLRDFGSGNNQHAQDMNYWPDEIDPTDEESFQEYLMAREGDRLSTTYGHGWGDWADDVEDEFATDEFDTGVPQTVGGDVTAGDVVRFTEPPDPRLDSTEWEVYHVGEGNFGRREVYMRDNQGHTISHEIRSADDAGVTDGDGQAGEFSYLGAAEVQAVAEDYSDIEDPGSEYVQPDESRFTSGGDDVPTVDEFRDELDAETWEDKIDNFASESNRAFYKMWLNKEHRDIEQGINSGYSSTTADEVPSEMHEVFQGPGDVKAETAAEVAETYPRLTAAYLELFEPSDDVRKELENVDGVTV
jgi:hypothetical protein